MIPSNLFLEAQCEAHGMSTDRRCTREALHWTHVFIGTGEPFPAGRLHLCWQHDQIVARFVRRGSAPKMLMLWQSLLDDAAE